jgi:hypothetical protein
MEYDIANEEAARDEMLGQQYLHREREKLFIPFEQAYALWELDFDEPSIGAYTGITRQLLTDMETEQFDKALRAPLWDQAFKFFVKNYKMVGVVDFDNSTQKYYYYITIMGNAEINWSKDFDTYPEAQLACLKQLIIEAKANC